MPIEALLPKLSSIRLKGYERRLNFPGEIFHFSRRGTPIFVCVAKVRSSFDKWVGGTHSDWITDPENPHGWKSTDEAIEKAVHKALDMRKKNLCHGLPFGGVKFTIFSEVPLVGGFRVHAYKLLGEALNFFNGHVFSGADVHTSTTDLMLAFGVSPYVLGLDKEYGGSGDPSPWTAVGVHKVIKEFFGIFHPDSKMHGKRVNIKGIGKVGYPLLKMLYDDGFNIGIADIRREVVEEARDRFRGVEKLSEDTIHAKYAHVYAPCDKEVTITSENTPEICDASSDHKWRAVIGSANDQNRHGMELEDALWRRQIVHLSQGGYLENGGGVITVVAPLVGGRNWDLLRDAKISGLADDCKLVMTQAQEENIAPARITEAVVEKRAKETGNEL
ncbi:MAG: hypothetical protein A2931_01045 [Candidatus Niyogibacteria bacterium RIFCSPLOWO2_01_FULL_45_48]|uniref:Glutamate/phenylalanine/leucine/valine/L-tryptophan dehydrogenase C-terminal domain-containing protein n=2 Tax=Candidatus Niyogiibacteriota TaxID=1817912 RepID=A0A1G2EWT5_9BACT|nr:MAG: hypothetical protein A3J00_00870 [Candidatus Niyogibacteria bacterium RIFCSPLOWO2_02_FULL_45_13]OGZ30695.1 MAG: hypothetical protein A2835_03855 [Candidatus Niyogibacteria bacterium RIFCSPHIGHO2_01_FULL_45_28]OGZ31135.1 MAG: hypothetical protein A2931_01045 [Candidatus Niyogibacteria bacterium RIFCSPLOWO2_01_FULL_45_48]